MIINAQIRKKLICSTPFAEEGGQYYWPESSALGNAAGFCLATLPMALPPKNFFA